MNLTQLIFMCKLQVPSIKDTGLSDSDLTFLINQAPDEINALADIYHGTTDFNIVADQQVYSLATQVPLFLGVSKLGARWLDSDGKRQILFPRTKKWLDSNIYNWADGESGDPQFYWQDGDEFGLQPVPTFNRTSGLRLYHLKKATPMDNGNHFPWNNGTSEITTLRPMDNAIIAYVRWKLSPALAKDAAGVINEQDFKNTALSGKIKINRRKDINSDYSYGMSVST